MKRDRLSEVKKLRGCEKNLFRNFLHSKLLHLNSSHKGIALIIALGTMIAIFIAGALSIYLITRGVSVTAGQTRYETAYEAAVASLEIGKARARYMNETMGINDTTDIVQVGGYTVNTYVERATAVAIALGGTAIKFARAIAGPGSTAAVGSYRTYYIRAQALGGAGEQVTLEVMQRYTIMALD
jgi:hypothetical protein